MRIRHTGLVFDDPAQSTPGFVLICPVESDKALLLAPDGSVAHEWQTQGGMTNWTYLLADGSLFRNERCATPEGVALTVSGQMSTYAADSSLLWRHVDPWQHHDARRLKDGVVYSAFADWGPDSKAKIPGGVQGSETDGGPFGEVIRHVNENGETIWEWSFHSLGFETHPLHHNSNRWSYGHTNTVCPVENGCYLVSSKNLNLLFIVDPKSNQVTWEYQNDALGGQHDAQMLENGNILVFANGLYGSDLSHSEIWEIDRQSCDVVWRYAAKDDFTSFYSPHMGGAQRLPSGNTLICEGSKGCLFEVTPDGDIVREFVSPHFVQSKQFGQHNWLFRCRWYATDSPEISALSRDASL